MAAQPKIVVALIGPDMASQAGDMHPHDQEHPAHASYVFLLDETGAVHPLPHALYVALAREDGAASMDLAGKRFRLADWYVRLREGSPERVVNEWYGWVSFDTQGRFDPAPTQSLHSSPHQPGSMTTDASALPTLEERRRMQELLFSEPNPGREE